MEDLKNKNGFLITCMSCILLLLVMCYFGINNSFSKGTLAATACGSGTYPVNSGNITYCCPRSTDRIVEHGGQKYCASYNLPSSVTIEAGACKYSVVASNAQDDPEELCKEQLGRAWSSSGGLVLSNDGKYIAICTLPFNDCLKPANGQVEYGCFQCGTQGNGSYQWGEVATFSASNNCVRNTSVDDQASCVALNNPSSSSSETGEDDEESGRMVNVVVDAGAGYLTYVNGATLSPNQKTYGSSCPIINDMTECSVAFVATAALDGHTFKGWGTKEGCTSGKLVSEYKVSKDTTLHACYVKDSTPSDEFKPITWTAKYHDDNGTEIFSDSCTTTATSNGVCRVDTPTTPPTKTGYTLVGWRRDDKSCSNLNDVHSGATISIAGNRDLYPCWDKIDDTDDGKDDDINPSSSTNVTANPQTGSIAIFVVWVIALAVIVYSVWYFKKIKEN